MSKTLYAIFSIERDKALGENASIQPGDVFDAPEAEATRYVNLSAAREATDEDVAVAKVRGRHFVTAADPVAVAKVNATVTAAKAEAEAKAKGGKTSTDPLV